MVANQYLVKTSEAADLLHCDRHYIELWARLGIIVPVRLDTDNRYRVSALQALIDNNLDKDFSKLKEMTPEGARKAFGVYQ